MEYPVERRLLYYLSIALAVLFSGYLYFVSASVLNVIARKEAVRKTAEIRSVIGSLEQRYFELSEDMTPETARRLGLSAVPQTSYVYRPGTVGLATGRTDEI